MGSHGRGAERLATARLSMRRPSIRDLDAIFAITSDPRTTIYNPSDAIGTTGQAVDLYDRWDEQWNRYGFGYWTVRLLDVPEILGFCGLKVMQYQGSTVLNLFYRLTPTAWGSGIASEAAAAVVTWAADHVPGCSVIARVRPANLRSQRVAEKAGLVRASYLDGQGFDGVDWVYASPWEPAAR